MTDEPIATDPVARIAVAMRRDFVAHPGYDAAREIFGELWQKRLAELDLGQPSEGRGIAIIGESGSGKTTAVRRILRQQAFAGTDPGELRWISLRVPTPATQKDLARAILRALEFPIVRDSTASRMWDLVNFHLHLRKTWFVHLDEGQELGGRGSDTERAAVINALKSLMQIPDWPINLIVSGTPELHDLLAKDPQLSRRFFVVRFHPVTELDARDDVLALLEHYAAFAELRLGPDLADVEFIPRLIHAEREQFGIIVEFLIGAITCALSAGRAELRCADFAQFSAARTGNAFNRNPFTAADFRTVPTGRSQLVDEPAPKPRRRR